MSSKALGHTLHKPQFELSAWQYHSYSCVRAKTVALIARKSHAAVDEEWDSVLLEIWSRSFSKLEGGKAPAADAQIFGVFIRIPSSILDGLLQTIVAGIYFETKINTKQGA